MLACSATIRVASWSERHFEGEETDDPTIGGLVGAVGLDLELVGLGHIEGDVGGERRLAHARAAREDHEIGMLQSAEALVEVVEPGGDARQLAVALVGGRRHVEGARHGIGEAAEAAIVAAGLGEFEQALLGVLDLRARRHVHRRVIGDIDHALADEDEVAPDGEIVDRPAVVLGIDDGGRFGCEAGEILRHRHAADVDCGVVHEGLQRHRRGNLAGADELRGNLVDLLVQRVEEVLGLQEVRDAVEGLVVDEDGAQQRLLGLDVVRGLAEWQLGRADGSKGGQGGHGASGAWLGRLV